MNSIIIALLIVAAFLVYMLFEGAGEVVLERLDRLDKRLTQRQRIFAIVALSISGLAVIVWIAMTHDYSGLLR